MIDKGSYDIIIQLVQELCESTEVALVFDIANLNAFSEVLLFLRNGCTNKCNK
jgi:hypothetical protein